MGSDISLFKIRDEAVILRNSVGVFTQTVVAIRGTYLYAVIGKNRFVQLYEGGFTSSPSTRWETVHVSNSPGAFGKLVIGSD